MTESYHNDVSADESETDSQAEKNNLYAPPYTVSGGCLCKETVTKSGESYVRLCNFAPRILCELILDDGVEQKRSYRIGGTDEYGQELRPAVVPATELESMSWLANNWDASCDLCVVSQVEKHVRCAIKSTARFAEKKCIFAHTGWRKIEGEWQYLLPGDDRFDVQLHGKQQNYRKASSCADIDLACLYGLLETDIIPKEVMYPCLALVFLSPLNEFLKQVGHEPKFLLTLIGRTGSMKSTVAALMLSFFGKFSATDLPMSFRDTQNSIVYNAFALKDVLTCVDDYHPTARRDSDAMRSTMQTLARGYGDRAARNRLNADITLREARPPQGNVIITAEFAPDIGESGTARLFCIEMKPGQINLPLLTEVQEMARGGRWMRCLFAYIEWLKEKLSFGEEQFLSELRIYYERTRTDWRSKLRENRIQFHDRLPDTLACLEVGFSFLLTFLRAHSMLKADYEEDYQNRFDEILLGISAKQSDAVTEDKPTHIFIRKLYALIESGQVSVVPSNYQLGDLPQNCIGYEDGDFFYLFLDIAHKAVKRICSEQDEGFAISAKALAKALADEGLIESENGENTRAMRFYGKLKRVMLLRKYKANTIEGGAENGVTA